MFISSLPRRASGNAGLWQADIGKTKLILLDTDIDENNASARSITDGLYPADLDKRMLQELLLGIGGVQALSAAGCEPDAYHLNEGHSAFLISARLRPADGTVGALPGAGKMAERLDERPVH